MTTVLQSVPGDSNVALTSRERFTVLVGAVSAWLFAGLVMGLFPLAARPATIAFLGRGEEIIGQWFAWYTCAFLLGAAVGGLVFGWVGDRYGRVRALALSVLCYSLLTGIGYWALAPWQLLVLRFLACMGIGGVWPNGVALASEAWSEASRPMLAGLFGTAINIGIVGVGLLGLVFPVTPETWRDSMLICSSPFLLALLIFWFVPESPLWLANRQSTDVERRPVSMTEVFTRPYLRITLIGITLGAIPLFGGWSSGNWLIPWADQAADKAALRARVEGDSVAEASQPDASHKAVTQIARSSGATLGGLIGGWLASLFGRRLVYFVISLGSFGVSYYIFGYLTPLAPMFVPAVFLLGFVTTIYFGWLPLCLPELFPTRVRAAGSGVTFNFGRIATAVGVLGAGALMRYYGNYAAVLAVTSCVYLLGTVVIWLAPDTSRTRLDA